MALRVTAQGGITLTCYLCFCDGLLQLLQSVLRGGAGAGVVQLSIDPRQLIIQLLQILKQSLGATIALWNKKSKLDYRRNILSLPQAAPHSVRPQIFLKIHLGIAHQCLCLPAPVCSCKLQKQ